MKKIVIFLLVSLSAKAQQNGQCLYKGTWVGFENFFRSPNAIVIYDSNLLLLRKNISLKANIKDINNPRLLHVLDLPGRIDTLFFSYKINQLKKGVQFILIPTKVNLVGTIQLIPKESIIGFLKIFKLDTISGHHQATFSIDFKDGASKVNTLKLIKI